MADAAGRKLLRKILSQFGSNLRNKLHAHRLADRNLVASLSQELLDLGLAAVAANLALDILNNMDTHSTLQARLKLGGASGEMMRVPMERTQALRQQSQHRVQ